MNTKINAIGMPEKFVPGAADASKNYYIREKINSKNLTDLMDLIVKSNPHLLKDPKNESKKKLTWPFNTPVEVAKNPAPVKGKPLGKKGKTEGKGKKKATVYRAFELIDGFHRFTLWRRLKQKEIPTTVKNITDPAARFLEQYVTNAGHGLRLDKDERDNYVRISHSVYKKSLSVLSKEVGLDRSSIARIIAEKQRKKEPRKKGGFSGSNVHQAELSVLGFYERAVTLVSNFDRLQKELSEFIPLNVAKNLGPSKYGAFVATLKKIVTTFESAKSNGERKAEQVSESA